MKKLELKNNEEYELTDAEGNAVLQGMVSKDIILLTRLEMALDPKMVSRVYTPKTYLGTKVYAGSKNGFNYRFCIRFGKDGIYTLQKSTEFCGKYDSWEGMFRGTIDETKTQMEQYNVVTIDEHIASSVKGDNTLDLPSENKLQLSEDKNNF